MKTKLILKKGMMEISSSEAAAITAGGDGFSNYISSVITTLSSGGGRIRTFVVGLGIFGMARMVGVAVEYARS